MRHRAIGFLVRLWDGVARRHRIVMQIPGKPVHPTTRRELHRWSRPIERESAIRRRWRRLADTIIGRRVECGVRPQHGIAARVTANHFAAILEDLELDRAACIVRQIVIDDPAGRRILAGGELRRPGRGIVRREPHTDRSVGLEQICRPCRARLGGLTQWCDVVEDPEAASMSPGDEIGAHTGGVILHLDVSHRDSRHVEAERPPTIPVIERHPDLCVGRRVEEPALARILAYRVGDRTRGDAVVDLGPGATAVVGAPEMRIVVVDAERVGGGVGGAIVEVAGFDVEDACPRFDRGRRHV